MVDVRRKLAVGLVTAGLLAGAAPAGALESTSTSILSTMVTGNDQSVVVSVNPAPESGVVKVKYLKRKDGKWVLKAKKTAEGFGDGLYTAAFNKAGKGTCKLVAIFKGNDTLASSKGSAKIDCATGARKE